VHYTVFKHDITPDFCLYDKNLPVIFLVHIDYNTRAYFCTWYFKYFPFYLLFCLSPSLLLIGKTFFLWYNDQCYIYHPAYDVRREFDVKLSLIIPFFNEEKQIPLTLSTLLPIVNSLDLDYEILLIDDGSGDNTWPLLEQAALYTRPANDGDFGGSISAILFSRNFGKEAAICAGLHYASGDAVILLDGDLQHPPEKIPMMVDLWRKEGFEIVEGIKSDRGKESFSQRLSASLFYRIFNKTSGYDLQNASDFKLLDKKVVLQWRNLGENETFFRALSVWLGFNRKSFEFDVPRRSIGKSKWSIVKLTKLSLNAITSFSALPLHLITLLGVVSLLLSLILGIQTLIRFASGTAADGFTTVILLQLFIGGLTIISLGLIGIYIARIFTEVKARPRYVISKSANMPFEKEKTSEG
jgi:dolichol-phosphate mannosyltransferase